MPIAMEPTKLRGFAPLPDNNAVGRAGLELRKKSEEQLKRLEDSIFWAAAALHRRANSKLLGLAALKSNWDSYGAPAPNDAAIRNAIRILELMEPFDLEIASIIPSAEGGIGFCFAKGQFYADIESSNEGEILGVRYVGMAAPILIQTDGTDTSIKRALEEIRNHFKG
jgi:hypothetical protein